MGVDVTNCKQGSAGALVAPPSYRRSQPIGPVTRLCLMGLVIAALTFWCGLKDARAHKVGLYGWTEGEFLIFEGYFGGGAKAVNCPVTLQGPGGKTIAEGKTDEGGLAKFKLADLPKFDGDIRAILDAGEGHRAEYTIQAADLPDRTKAVGAANASARAQEATVPSPQAPAASTSSTGAPNQAGTSEAVRQAVAVELKPVLQKLATVQRLLLQEQDKGPSLKDIVGGIGWIMGLVGLWAYFAGTRAGTSRQDRADGSGNRIS